VIVRSMGWRLDPKPNYEAPRRLAYKADGWLASEIWLKSAGLTSQLKLAFTTFYRFQVHGTKTVINLTNRSNTLSCL